MSPPEGFHCLDFFAHDFEIFGDLEHKWDNLLELCNVLDLVNIPKCALAEFFGDKELVEKNISDKFFAKKYLYLIIRLVVFLAIGNFTDLNLFP